MNDTIKAVQDDLAFMKSLVEGDGRGSMRGASIYLAAGLFYGLECLFHYGQALGVIRVSFLASMVVVVGTTTAFLAVMVWGIRADRARGSGGVANRAVNAAFGGAGLANLAMVCVFGVAAVRSQSMDTWLLYPTVVFALQGAVWYVVFMMRRRLWLLVVALGWMLTAVVMGLLIGTPNYNLVAALGLLAWMAVPGAVMMRLSRQAG